MKKILFGISLCGICTITSVNAFSFNFGSSEGTNPPIGSNLEGAVTDITTNASNAGAGAFSDATNQIGTNLTESLGGALDQINPVNQAQQFANNKINETVSDLNPLSGVEDKLGLQNNALNPLGGIGEGVSNQVGGIATQVGDAAKNLNPFTGTTDAIGGQIEGIQDGITTKAGELASGLPGVSEAQASIDNLVPYQEPIEVVRSGLPLNEGTAEQLSKEIQNGEGIITQGQEAITNTKDKIGELKVAQVAAEKTKSVYNGTLSLAKKTRDSLFQRQGNIDQSITAVQQDIDAKLAEVKTAGTDAGFGNITEQIQIPDAPKNSFIQPIARLSRFLMASATRPAIIDQRLLEGNEAAVTDTGKEESPASIAETFELLKPVPVSSSDRFDFSIENSNTTNQFQQSVPILNEDIVESSKEYYRENLFNDVQTTETQNEYLESLSDSDIVTAVERDKLVTSSTEYYKQNLETEEKPIGSLSEFEIIQAVYTDQNEQDAEEIQSIQEQQETAREQLADAQQAVAQAEENLDLEKLSQFQEEKRSLETQLTNATTATERNRIQEEIQEVETRIKPLETEERLRTDEADLRIQIAELEAEQESCETNCDQIQTALTQANADLKNIEQERRDNLSERKTELENAQAAETTAREKVETTQNQEHEAVLALQEQKQEQALTLSTQANTAAERDAAAQALLEATQNTRNEALTRKNRLEQQKAVLEDQRSAIERRLKECEDAVRSIDCTFLREELAAVNQSLDENTQSLNDVNETLSQLNPETIEQLESEALAAKRANLESYLTGVEGELVTLKNDLTNAEAALENCKTNPDDDCSAQQAEVERLTNEIAKKETEATETQNGVAITDLKEQITMFEETQEEIEELEQRRSQAEQELEQAELALKECQETSNDCATQREAVEDAQNAIALIDQQLDEKHTLIDPRNEGKILELKQSMDELEDLKAEKERLEKEKQEIEERMNQCEEDSTEEALAGCVEKYEAELAAIEAKIQANEAAIETAQQEIETLEASIVTARANILAAKTKLAEYNCEYLDFTNEGNQSTGDVSGYCVQLSHGAHIGDVKSIRGENGLDLFSQYVGVLYRYAASIVGIIAVLIIVISGVQISVAGINSELASSAKTRIFQALLSLILLFLIGMILRTVNPTFFT